jgi:hypothetical protein
MLHSPLRYLVVQDVSVTIAYPTDAPPAITYPRGACARTVGDCLILFRASEPVPARLQRGTRKRTTSTRMRGIRVLGTGRVYVRHVGYAHNQDLYFILEDTAWLDIDGAITLNMLSIAAQNTARFHVGAIHIARLRVTLCHEAHGQFCDTACTGIAAVTTSDRARCEGAPEGVAPSAPMAPVKTNTIRLTVVDTTAHSDATESWEWVASGRTTAIPLHNVVDPPPPCTSFASRDSRLIAIYSPRTPVSSFACLGGFAPHNIV